MTKLSDKQVRNMVRRVVVHDEKPASIRTTYGVSTRRVQQLAKLYRDTGRYPVLMKSRRPRVALSKEQKQIIEEVYKETFRGAQMLYYEIQKRKGVTIPKNKIHAHLKERGFAKPDPKKQKARKRCRYERRHSFSLLHTDWTEWNSKQVIAVQDDASRFILSGGEYENATGELSIGQVRKAQEIAKELNAVILDVNSDMGTQFYATKKKNAKKRGMARFEKYLTTQGIKHIPSRRNNPQTNGKLERWVREYKRHRARFNSFEEFTAWHNELIHGGLNPKKHVTPKEAMIQKLQPESILGLFYKNVVS